MQVRHGNLTQIAAFNSRPQAGLAQAKQRNRANMDPTRSQSTLSKRSKQPYQPPDPPRGRTQTNPLMAGRRRRTPAAALRWPRCRCRCRSSSRSTCAGIECHSSPRVVFMICCPRDYEVLDGVEGHDGTNAQDNLTTQRLSSTPSRHRSRPPVGASGSNSIFGAS